MNNHIVFDLDDTLADMKNPLMKALSKYSGFKIHWNEWEYTNICELYKITDNILYEILFDNKIIENLKPHDNVKKVLEKLKTDGYKITIITARAWHPTAYITTQEWFDENKIIVDDIIVVPPHGNKISSLKHLNSIVLAVDDRPSHCVAFNDCDKIQKTIIFDQPWNRHLNNIQRIKSINEIFKFI